MSATEEEAIKYQESRGQRPTSNAATKDANGPRLCRICGGLARPDSPGAVGGLGNVFVDHTYRCEHGHISFVRSMAR